jgi:transcriptional regulator with XRE-family HTH domain
MENIIGTKITELIKKMELKRSDVAEFLEIDTSTLSRYESGQRNIPLKILEKLSDLFGISLSELLDENKEASEITISFAFRKNSFIPTDLERIAEFSRIIKNYFKIEKIEKMHGIKV